MYTNISNKLIKLYKLFINDIYTCTFNVTNQYTFIQITLIIR